MVNLPKYFVVFDVEAVGLHGPPFAVGWVVLDTSIGRVVDEGYRACTPWESVRACEADELDFYHVGRQETGQGMAFIREHVLPALPHSTDEKVEQVLQAFKDVWADWKEKGAWLAADVPWPVESAFLHECVLKMPNVEVYPLIDVASVRFAAGVDPLYGSVRLDSEMPIHHPTQDARHSARLLWEALGEVRNVLR